MFDFSDQGLTLNLFIFAAAASLVWLAGSRIALYADEIARRSGLGQAVIGVLLLAGVTSLPEIATSFTSALHDDANLAVNNLFGSIAMQVAVLAVADQIYHQRALTSIVPNPTVMVQGVLNICLLTGAALIIGVGDQPLLGAGIGSWGLFIIAVWSFVHIARNSRRQPWIANISDDAKQQHASTAAQGMKDSNRILALKTGSAATVILLAGALVASSAEVLAQQTGLGSSFMGMAFVAISTSLPEASTVFAAMKRGLYTLAISDILGTNIINVALLLGVDLLIGGQPVLNQTGVFASTGALLGVLVTAIFLYGLVERRDKTISRMGTDSALVLLVYGAGLLLLYQLR